MEFLERTLRFVAEPDSQPINQLRLRRGSTHPAKIARRIAEAAAEMVVPDTVYHTAPSQNILRMCQPVRQCRTALGLVLRILQGKTRRQVSECGKRARLSHSPWFIEVPALQNIHNLWLRKSAYGVTTGDSDGWGGGIDDGLGWKTGQRLVCSKTKQVCRQDNALGLRPLGSSDGDGSFDVRWPRGGIRSVVRSYGKTESAYEVTFAVSLFEHDREAGPGFQCEWLGEFKDRVMRLPHRWINSPCRFDIAVERAFDAPAVLVKVGGRAAEFHKLGLHRSGLENAHPNLREMKIAMVLATGPVHREGVMGKHVEAQGGNVRECRGRSDGVGIFVGTRAAGENCAVGLALECRAFHRQKCFQFKRLPTRRFALLRKPGGRSEEHTSELQS